MIAYYQLTLAIAKHVGDRATEARAYIILGDAYHSVADFKRAIEYHQLHLSLEKEVGDMVGEGSAYGNLGIAYSNLGDFQKSLEYHLLHLSIAQETGNRPLEGRVNGDIGNAYCSLGDFETAVQYHQLHLSSAKEVGDKAGEGRAYNNLGNAYLGLGDLEKAIECQQLQLLVLKEEGDKEGEGSVYLNLGVAYCQLGNFKKAVEYQKLALRIAKQLGDVVREGSAYDNLGNAYCNMGDFQQAKQNHELSLSIAKTVGNRRKEGSAYSNLGIDYCNLGDFQKAIEYQQFALAIFKEMEDLAAEGRAYSNLGIAYWYRSDFKTAIEYHHKHLNIVKKLGDKAGEGSAYNNLGNALNSLGEFQEAVRYYERCLGIPEKVQNRAEEGRVCGNLGYANFNLGQYEKAIDYYNKDLIIAKEVGDRAEEGGTYSNLGIAYKNLGNFPKAIESHELHLRITKEVNDRAGEGCAYSNLGNVYYQLGDYEKVLEYSNLELCIAKEVGDNVGEGISYFNQGKAYFALEDLCKAEHCLTSSVKMFDNVRSLLQSKDQWKVTLRNRYQEAYTLLLMVLLQQNKIEEALCTAERGRGQALTDLMESRYSLKPILHASDEEMERISELSFLSSQTVFLAVDKTAINYWILQKGEECHFRRKEIDKNYMKENVIASLESLNKEAYSKIGVLKSLQCENRTWDEPKGDKFPDDKVDNKESVTSQSTDDPLRLLYDLVINPIVDLLHGGELTIVPDGPLFLAPFAALKDQHSTYLSEKTSIRLIPTLKSLKIMAECSVRDHSTTGALLVGDPWLGSVRIKGRKPDQLPNAKKEVEMIGKILSTEPLTDKRATKAEVLSKLSSVALVHIAAHGKAETDEIMLSPNSTNKKPKEKDYLLTMEDVKDAKLNARLVVLSCCHSGRGEIKAEGVVGIARAFLGAGARSVLASLWAIDDAATFKFMEIFYKQLVEEKHSASKSLKQAMKQMRESENFNDVRLWAPFVLIGDDVTLDFAQTL